MTWTGNEKEFKEWTWVKRIFYDFFLAFFIVLVVVVLLIKIFNVHLSEVLSDSMYPVFTKDDIVVVVEQKEYKVGDIISYYKGDGRKQTVTHRIVDYNEATKTFTTRGEHYGATDDATIKKEQIQGKVIGIWFNGSIIYNTIKDNYLLIFIVVLGAWVASSLITDYIERKNQDILKSI